MAKDAPEDSNFADFGPLPKASRFLRLPRSVRGNLLVLLLVLLVPLLALQAYVSYRNYQDRRAHELTSNLEVARAAGVAFDAYIRDLLNEELALGTAIVSATAPPDMNGYLKVNADQYPSLREFFWIDPSGKVLGSSNPALVGVAVGDRDYFQSVTGGKEWAVSDLIQARVGGEPVFVIARGVLDANGALRGVMAATVLPDKLGAALPIERTGRAAIAMIDRQGRLVYRSPDVQLTWEQRSSTQNMRMVSQSLAGEEVTGEFVSEIDGEGRLGAYAPVQPLGWVSRASQPTADVTVPLIWDVLRDAVLFLFISAAAFAAAWLVSRRITGPLERLEAHAAAIASGELGVQAQVSGPLEMERVAEAFNRMSKEIRLHQEQLTAESARSRDLAEQAQHRATELDAANKELEAFSYSVSHDLRAPLRTIDGFSKALLEDSADKLDEDGRSYLQWVRTGSQRMGQLIDDMLALSRVTRSEMRREKVDLSEVADEIAIELREAQPERKVEFAIAPGVVTWGDTHLLRLVMQNLLGNAWKFTSKRDQARIEFGSDGRNGESVYFVRDNGAGFDMEYSGKLFGAFQRLHAEEEFSGTGIGLATVQRIVRRHGGRIWAESAVDHGATFYFTLSGGQE